MMMEVLNTHGWFGGGGRITTWPVEEEHCGSRSCTPKLQVWLVAAAAAAPRPAEPRPSHLLTILAAAAIAALVHTVIADSTPVTVTALAEAFFLSLMVHHHTRP